MLLTLIIINVVSVFNKIAFSMSCGPLANKTSQVLWPTTQEKSCTLSIPGCIDSSNILQIKCCEDGQFDDVSCIYDDDMKDPRCFEGMQSTLPDYTSSTRSIQYCYSKLTHNYPFQCKSSTGEMIPVDLQLLSEIGGMGEKIWLPIERFGDTFRYTSLDNFYMDSYSLSIVDGAYCMALSNNMSQPVSCSEVNLGICLDYPYVIYKISFEKLEVLFSSVKSFCNNAPSSEFCSTFDYTKPLNVAYFSSRKYFSKHFLFLQKQNLRIVVQIREQSVTYIHGFVFLFVALSTDDWNTFSSTEYSFEVYPATQENIYVTPKITLIKYDNSIIVRAESSQNIKSIRKDKCSVYCFFKELTSDALKKLNIEINDTWKFNLGLHRGSIWCDAFDYDLNIIKSNVLEVESENDHSAFVSLCIVTFNELFECTLKIEMVQNLMESAAKDDQNFIPSIWVKTCEDDSRTVDVKILWYLVQSSESVEEIDQKFLKLKAIVDNMPNFRTTEIEEIYVAVLGHTDYCLKDIMYFENQTVIWPTSPKNHEVLSQPFCYQFNENAMIVKGRQCVTSGKLNQDESYWQKAVSCCNNITFILEQFLLDGATKINILGDLNLLLKYWYQTFKPIDVYLVSKILLLVNDSQTSKYVSSSEFPQIINNLHKIGKEVLSESQDKYNATDSILDMITNIYGSHRIEEPFSDKYYSNIPIDLIPPINFPKIQEPFVKYLLSFLTFYDISEYAVVSIFFKSYLFNGDHATNLEDAIIFQALTFDPKYYMPFTIFSINNGNVTGQYCVCWNYGLQSNSSKWRKVAIIKNGSDSVCIFKTTSYCSVLHSDFDMSYDYVSRLHVQYDVFAHLFQYSITVALNEILEKVFLQQVDISWENEEINECSESQGKSFFVRFHFARPEGSTPNIQKEWERLSTLLQSTMSLTNNVITEIKLQYIRHLQFCGEETTGDSESGIFHWPQTKLGCSTEATPKCYSSNDGAAHSIARKCLGNAIEGAYWEEPQPCSQSPNVTNILEYLIDNFNYTAANDVLNNLDIVIKNSSEYFTPNDVSLIAKIFMLLSSVTEETELDFSSLSSVASGVQMLNQDVLVDAQKEYNSTDKILYYLDTILLSSKEQGNYSHQNPEFYLKKLSNCENCRGAVLQVFEDFYNVTTLEGEIDYDQLAEYENFEAAVVFNDTLLKDIQKSKDYSIIISIFFKNALFNEMTAKHEVTNIFGILIPNYEVEIFPGAINLIYKNYTKAQDCAYWEYGMKNKEPIRGSWKDESNSHPEKKFFTCQFNHTTHFAMLIGDVDDETSLTSLLTDIGCLLSIVGLFGILVTGLIFEKWRKNVGNIILSNFVLTILFQIGLYYLSAFVKIPFPKTQVCILTGALLHYSVISEFCWMLIIAVLQFKRFVQVLTGPPKYLILKSLFVGWVLPLIPVISVLTTNPNSYTSAVTGLCYPSNLGLYLGVWLPIIVILFINFIIFSYIMYSIFHRKTECVDTVTNEVIFQWRLAFLLFFMLGLTWSFAFVGQFIFADLFLNLFSLCATLQGFVMFLFFIVFDKRTRSMYTLLFKRFMRKYTS